MRKHKSKIYYSAGFISIILLPILCVLNSKNNEAFTNCCSIDIQIWDGKEDDLGNKGLTKFLNSKKYTTVNLNGDSVIDLKKIDKAAIKIKGITLSKDSIRGVKFHFGPNSDYATFIRVLDVLAIQKAGFYVPYKDDIFVANPKPIRSTSKQINIIPHIFKCGYSSLNEQNDNFIDWLFWKEKFKKYYLVIILYFLMVFFQFKSMYNKYFLS
ncbi:hypothetical protein [Flavobacterium facile]|uniref:hypothetical protein n=1 Tax=Flavobacterium facile TaxID=2893174 RepID=UPI002E78F1E9|nr:hypothetical protein [Flavobacterium sp. T-12]